MNQCETCAYSYQRPIVMDSKGKMGRLSICTKQTSVHRMHVTSILHSCDDYQEGQPQAAEED